MARKATKAKDSPAENTAAETTAIEREDAEAGRVLAAGLAATPPAVVVPMVRALRLDDVFPSPLNPRRQASAAQLEELGTSLVANGQLQPILVRPSGSAEGRTYEIICGSRRHKAAQIAVADGRLPADWTIAAAVRECDDGELVILAATENLARQDMTPIEEAEVFAAMAAHIKHEPGERAAHAVARRLGIGERTVFRRMQLLRLCPEAKDDLAAGELNITQAAALALGGTGDQQAWLKCMQRDQWACSPEQIRRAMTGTRPRLETAFFPLERYDGEIVADAETEHQYFADAKLFQRLQKAAIAERLAELRHKYAWAELVEHPYGYHDCKKGDAEAGAILTYQHTPEGTILVVRAPVIKPEVVKARERQAEKERQAAVRALSKGGEDTAAPRTLTVGQAVAAKRAKTLAMRRGAAVNPKVGVALTIIGLVGCTEIHVSEGTVYPPNVIEPADGDIPYFDEVLAPIPAALAPEDPDAERPGVMDMIDVGLHDSQEAADIFRGLLQLELDALLEMQAMLIAQRIGTWTPFGGKQVGDTPFACAVAHAVDAPEHLQHYWAPDRAYLEAYPRDLLFRLAQAVDRFGQVKGSKKGEAASYLATLPPATWTPDRFTELLFLEEDAMAAALAKPVPGTLL